MTITRLVEYKRTSSISTQQSKAEAFTRSRGRLTAWKSRIIGIDGEGWDIDELGRQYYKLLVAASNRNESWYLYRENGIHIDDALNFLLDLPRAHYTSFSFTYDITQLLRTIDDEQVLTDICKTESYTRWKNYKLLWYRGKKLSIKKDRMKEAFIIWDAYPYYQKSLIEAIKDSREIISDESMTIIRQGKARRGDENKHIVAEELPYAIEECKALAKMQHSLFTNFERDGIEVTGYYGPGSLAAAKLKQHTIVSRKDIDDKLVNTAKQAYFGGRFETIGHGFKPILWDYDLNSAYPAASVTLPCMVHSTWLYKETAGLEYINPFSLYNIEWKLNSGKWGPFPERYDNNHLHFPYHGRSWVWGIELKEGIKLDCKVNILAVWEFQSNCNCHPFAFIPSEFNKRKELQALKDGLEKVYKLWLNSLYGKFAQKIGQAPYQNFLWAGLITASCRAKLLAVIARYHEHIIATATDGLMSDCELDLELSDNLGEWGKVKTYTDCLVLQPGVWCSKEYSKTRGCHSNEMNWDGARSVFRQLAETKADGHTICATRVPVPNHTKFITLTEAISRGNYKLAGRWETGNHTFKYWSRKRPLTKWISSEWIETMPLDRTSVTV